MRGILFLIIMTTFSLVLSAQQCYTPNMSAGKTEFNKGNYNQAAKYFETAKICGDKPGDYEADEWVSKCNIKNEEKKKEDCFYACIKKGEEFFNQEKFNDAITEFKSAQKCGANQLNAIANKWIEKCQISFPWTKFYSKSEFGEFSNFIQLNDTLYAAIGIRYSSDERICLLFNLDNQGNIISADTINLINSIHRPSIIKFENDNIGLIGTTNEGDILIAKIDKLNVVWEKTLSTAGKGYFIKSIIATSDFSYIILTENCMFLKNSDNSFTIDDNNMYAELIKFDKLGNILFWIKTPEDISNLEVKSIVQDLDGNYIIAGSNNRHTEVIIVKFDNSNNIIWKKMIDDGDHESADEIIQTANGDYMVYGHIDFHPLLIKLDNSGNILFKKELEYPGKSIYGTSFIQIDNNSFLGLGLFETDSRNNIDNLWLCKVDEFGNIIWKKTHYLKNSNIQGCEILQTNDGGFLINLLNWPASGEQSNIVIKLTKEGNLK